eukprot:COSAG04_NODE_582_length_12404_cov_81.591792_12_plen_85_part_00
MLLLQLLGVRPRQLLPHARDVVADERRAHRRNIGPLCGVNGVACVLTQVRALQGSLQAEVQALYPDLFDRVLLLPPHLPTASQL